MMIDRTVPIIDILFVFNMWTLIITASERQYLEANTEILLLDEHNIPICKAHILPVEIMGNRNPKIETFHISVMPDIEDATIRTTKSIKILNK